MTQQCLASCRGLELVYCSGVRWVPSVITEGSSVVPWSANVSWPVAVTICPTGEATNILSSGVGCTYNVCRLLRMVHLSVVTVCHTLGPWSVTTTSRHLVDQQLLMGHVHQTHSGSGTVFCLAFWRGGAPCLWCWHALCCWLVCTVQAAHIVPTTRQGCSAAVAL